MSEIMSKAKSLLYQYYIRITQGCGDCLSCTSEYCKSSGRLGSLSQSAAVQLALDCLRRNAALCPLIVDPNSSAKEGEFVAQLMDTMDSEQQSSQLSSVSTSHPAAAPKDAVSGGDSSGDRRRLSSTMSAADAALDHLLLTEEAVLTLTRRCRKDHDYLRLSFSYSESENGSESSAWTPMRRWLGKLFSDADLLLESFTDAPPALVEVAAEDGASAELVADCTTARRVFGLLFERASEAVSRAVLTALTSLLKQAEVDLICRQHLARCANVVLLLAELPILGELVFAQELMLLWCATLARLPLRLRAAVARRWALEGRAWLLERVHAVQMALTMHVIAEADRSDDYRPPEDDAVGAAVRALHVLYCASVVASRLDGDWPAFDHASLADVQRRAPVQLDETQHACACCSTLPDVPTVQSELGVNLWSYGHSVISVDEFQNKTLSDYIDVPNEIFQQRRRAGSLEDSDLRRLLPTYSFVVSAERKVEYFFVTNRVRMSRERSTALYEAAAGADNASPYLNLSVRRHAVVNDALSGLGRVSKSRPRDLKKQLRVHFEGERGVDEGGVSKEFYQLVFDQLFNPDYGMFVYNEQTRLFWLNPHCGDSAAEFRLIGLLLGLAIYNGVLVNTHFPIALYKKLCGHAARLADLAQLDPVCAAPDTVARPDAAALSQALFSGLQQLLSHDGDDVEATFCYSFRIAYRDVFGNQMEEDLKAGGQRIPVTKDNRREFVRLYADFLLNRSVAPQFDELRAGFGMVCDGDLLEQLFSPDELEQLVSGVPDLDFNLLKRGTTYENGYTASSPTIEHFWTCLLRLTDGEKLLFLQFTTGGERAPLGGLERLRLRLVRNGDDRRSLPTAQTCFNALLLPDYGSLSVLDERLRKAITYCRGFGLQ